MKALLRFTLTAAAAYAFAQILMKRARADLEEIPTLRAPQDAEPELPEPLREADLNVAQNAPL